ncbi:coproporphyrinogen dehydrogenase HemZ [Veillonella criceti]|uniref:Oxygen-independent coproporphyrinogen-III oxidase 2 n=1 Tax=Veillonella criceti TaxID=103891 RepID=A0A380NMX4_9FIRM|nr:coproporphyrinogen dehydrogenase HemZ [Veillonella criceti]SUP45054.1 Oxygen-independent coproporphyrinogen-III oxidase 2 [Veillonella criceti]
MNKLTYSYSGPLPLGSVVAHYCGAAGLTTYKENPMWRLAGQEDEHQYVLSVYRDGQFIAIFTGAHTNEGRLQIGGQLLRLLRTHRGLPPLGDWGTLVGVRPTKLFHKLWDKLGSAEAAVDCLRQQYEVTEPKIDLLQQVATLQRPYVAPNAKADRMVSVYGGIPFCQTHCTYCSFPYGLIQDYKRVPQFVEAFVKDSQHLQRVIAEYELQLSTLYLGGGTPTSLSDADFETIVSSLAELQGPNVTTNALEFTVEAGRPDSVTPHKLRAMERVGVNRISINPQSMHDFILKAIGRGHTAKAIRDLYRYVRQHTSFQVNMDFIAGLPYQTEGHMIENMDYICQAMPENVTIHTLALKRGSPLYEGVGREAMPEEQAVEAMVAYCKGRLEAAGYVPYYVYRQQYMTSQTENIGYTLPGHVCEYNIRIMEERQSILSVGPGSSSKWMRAPEYRQLQQHMPKDVSVYIDTLDTLLGKRSQLCKQFWEG